MLFIDIEMGFKSLNRIVFKVVLGKIGSEIDSNLK